MDKDCLQSQSVRKVSEEIMMQENNLLNRNSTDDIQGVKSTYASMILISSIETEHQLSYKPS